MCKFIVIKNLVSRFISKNHKQKDRKKNRCYIKYKKQKI